jgi:phosphoribosylamine--glycine ligase
VMVASRVAEALAAVDALMGQRRVGDAGRTLVVEERLEGPEVSYFAVVDGVRAVGLGSAQDHKRAFDGDRGPNTGGMGAFSPSPLVTPDLDARIMRDIVAPVVEALRREGTPFVGFLYAGLMLTADGPRVIEFNVRLGDPEAQVVLPRLTAPLAPILLAAARGRLDEAPAIEMCDSKHVGVVLASRGYPDQVESGHPIEGLEDAEALDHVLVFHAGTRVEAGRVVTAGGRVLTVVGGCDTFEAARGRAYAGVRAIRFEGCDARTDIGLKALSP